MPTTQTSYVKMSKLIPYRFHKVGSGDFFYNQIPSFEHQKGFRQLSHWGANIYFQFMCLNSNLDIGGATGSYCYIKDINGTAIRVLTIEKLTSPNKIGDYTVYCVRGNFPTSGTDGTYFLWLSLEVTSGLYWTFYSEPFHVKTSHPDSIMLEYEHTENDFDIIWTASNSQQMFIEIEGGLKSEHVTPGGKFTVYTDLEQKPVMLNAVPFNTYKFTFGGSLGIPNYLMDKINRALACDKFYIDNVRYVRSEGAKLERNGDELFPLAGWTCDLMLAENEGVTEFNAAGIGAGGTWDDTGNWQDDQDWTDDSIYLTVDPMSQSIGAGDTLATFAVTSNARSTVTSNSSWAVTDAYGENDWTLNVVCEVNTGNTRVALITITPEGGTPVVVELSQDIIK